MKHNALTMTLDSSAEEQRCTTLGLKIQVASTTTRTRLTNRRGMQKPTHLSQMCSIPASHLMTAEYHNHRVTSFVNEFVMKLFMTLYSIIFIFTLEEKDIGP